MSYTLPLNVSVLGLNPNAKEFKPQFSIKTSSNKTNYSNIDEEVLFDNLEQDFIKNNQWLFLV